MAASSSFGIIQAPDDDLGDREHFTDSVWGSVKKDYIKDSYYVKGFETLHLFNVRLYEREISRLEYQIAVEGRLTGEMGDNTDLRPKLRRLLREYSKNICFSYV